MASLVLRDNHGNFRGVMATTMANMEPIQAAAAAAK